MSTPGSCITRRIFDLSISHIRTMAVPGYVAAMSSRLEPCNFPSLVHPPPHAEEEHATRLQLSTQQTAQLMRFCEQNGVKDVSVLQATWALTLRCYTGSDTILFAYRDAKSSSWVCGDLFEGSDPMIKHLERRDASSAACWAVPEGEWPQLERHLFNSSLTISEPGTFSPEVQTQDRSKVVTPLLPKRQLNHVYIRDRRHQLTEMAVSHCRRV